MRAFEANEFLVNLIEEDFVLTSQALYFFKPEKQVILLRDIQKYQTKGILHLTLEVTMSNGEKRPLPEMDTLPEDRYVHYLIEQSYNAS